MTVKAEEAAPVTDVTVMRKTMGIHQKEAVVALTGEQSAQFASFLQ